MDHALTRADLWIAIIGGAFAIIASLGGVQFLLHRQNQQRDDQRNRIINFILGEHIPHSHGETGDNVPLTTRGLSYTKHRIRNGIF